MPAQTLRPALLSPRYWPEVRRGSERFLRELADGLIELGHGPTLVTSHPGWPRRSREDGLDVVRHWRPPDGTLRRRGFDEYLTHLPFTYLSLVAGRYDLAHAVYPTDALAALRWARRTGRPTLLSFMGVPERASLVEKRVRLRAVATAASECDAVVALSRAAAEGFRRWLGIDPRVIPPGVDLDAFTPASERSVEPTVFCAADAGRPRKRVGLLVRAFRRARRRRPGTRLIISRPRDPSVARALEGAGPEVELRDVDARDSLSRAYGEAWVTALPSVGEAFGLVLVESLACGTPVVGSAAGGIPEIVDRKTVGRLFPPDDEEALAAALLETLELAEEPGTAAACRLRAADFDARRCAAAYEALYRELAFRRDNRRSAE